MEPGTIEFLLKAQKNHLTHLRQTRPSGVYCRTPNPPRVFQPWPTGQVQAAQKRRMMKGTRWGCFPKRAKQQPEDENVPLQVQEKLEKINISDKKVQDSLKSRMLEALRNKEVVQAEKLLPGSKKPLQTVDLTMEMENSLQNSTLDVSKLDQSEMDQSTMDQISAQDQSAVDELPSEASFSRHLEDRPDTACSTPAKPDPTMSDANDSFTSKRKTPKRKLDSIDLEGE